MRIALASLLALAAAPLVAQQMPKEAPGKPDIALVKPATYKVDPAHTQVLFTVTHLGFSEYTGQFTQPSGMLVLDPKSPAGARVDISFPIAKVSTTVQGLNDHLQKPEFFDAAKYPTGHFVSTKIEAHGRHATIAGNLTLKGVTRPVILSTDFIGAGAMAMGGPAKTNIGFAATATIKRSDFGIDYGVPLVSDEVKLTINAAFEEQ